MRNFLCIKDKDIRDEAHTYVTRLCRIRLPGGF